jgi:hypothetical protein
MIKNWLASTATFSPPDEGGSAPAEAEVVDTGGEAPVPEGGEAPADDAAPAAPAAKEDHAKPRVESTTDSIKRAVAETKEKAEAAAKAKTTKAAKSKDSPQAGAETGDTAKPDSETTADGNTAAAPQAAAGPPQAWSKEEKALWNDLPEAARTAILRREVDATKGVQELRTRYQDIDSAVAPYKAVMTQNNVTPAQAITQLFKWHMELAGPNKVQAFQQLAKSFGVDPATIAAAPVTTEAQAGADQGNTIPENLRPVITNLETRLKTFEDSQSAAMQTAAKQTWVNWSKDKPHAETVRGLMANLINSDLALIQAGQNQISNTIKDGSIDMDAAYQAAIYAHPEVRATLLQEEQARRDKEVRAAAEKAKKAGASLRSGAPAGAVDTSKGNAPRVESVADSIKRALAEVRGTQH